MPAKDALAIVGIGCRLPGGANDPDSFWRLLCDGIDAIREVPPDRWNAARFYDPRAGRPGKSCTRWGGFIDGIDQFDANFFGISPREAARIDPQQRLLLETAWEAVEDGGQVLECSEGSAGGVFIGISHTDFQVIQSAPADRTTIDAYSATGSAHSVAANRISFFLNLCGPSLAVDTACSSSLTAVHLACQSIWNGECPWALAGGVNVIINPDAFIGFSHASMLSPDGRCYAFDARANGFARAEGAGMVVLKPLSAALAAGDRIYALVLGTAANQDGRTSGLTVPSASAQEALVHQACASAGIRPSDLHFVEAHGTGTPVGDPIEFHALGAALSPGREERHPCLIGSVKTNIGHLESAAGIAGLIKATLSLHYGLVPPHLHFQQPNPHLELDRWKLNVATSLQSFPEDAERRLAGVNSFGFGGANAHAVLASAPVIANERSSSLEETKDFLFPLSAGAPAALQALASKWSECLKTNGDDSGPVLRDLAYTAGQRRHHLRHRLAIVSRSREQLVESLASFASGSSAEGISLGEAAADGQPRIVFVFSGQGPQWCGMGRDLFRHEPVFREAIEACDAAMREYAPWSLIAELMADGSHSRLDQTAIAQPSIFAIQVALAALWRSWGIEPAAVVGHSVGEVAAAHFAGCLTLSDASRVVVHRGRLMEHSAVDGGMLAVGLSPDQAAQWSAPYDGAIFIAAHNSPVSVTLSGERTALQDLERQLAARSIFCRMVPVRYPFHSPHMDRAAVELRAALAGLAPQAENVPIQSTVTGQPARGEELTAHHWGKSVREPVLFSPVIEQLIAAGNQLFLEVSPHPALAVNLQQCLAGQAATGRVVTSLRRGQPERATLLNSLGQLYAAGCRVAWSKLAPSGRCIRLPSYPWQRTTHWHEADECRRSRTSAPIHPLLERRPGGPTPTWETNLCPARFPFVADHRVEGRIVFPGAGYLEMVLAAGREIFGQQSYLLEEVEFQRALFLPEDDSSVCLQLTCEPAEASFHFDSQTGPSDAKWTRHVTGQLRPTPKRALENIDPASLLIDDRQEVPLQEYYEQRKQSGLEFGPSFQTLQQVWQSGDCALGKLQLPQHLIADAEQWLFHPSLLDGCFQVLSCAAQQHHEDDEPRLFLPVAISRLQFYSRPGTEIWVQARITRYTSQVVEGDLSAYDTGGNLVMDLRGFRAQAVERPGSEKATDNWLYELTWELKPLDGQELVCQPADYLPDLRSLKTRVQREAAECIERMGWNARYREVSSAIDRLCRTYIWRALHHLGWQPKIGEPVTPSALLSRCAIATKYELLIARFLSILGEDGSLQRNGESWQVARTPEIEDPGALWSSILARCPAAYPELMLIARCGSDLAGVLTGHIDPLQLIFAHNSWNLLEHLYSDGWSFRRYNLMLREALATAVQRLPEGRRIRILEIGGGTGGLTSYVLPILPADQVEYVFSDVSNSFFSRAEQKFRDHRVDFRLLDIDQDPTSQGFDLHSFDIILASDVFHATASVGQSLKNVRLLLAPGGLFLFLDVVRPMAWVDLVFGLTDGWWRFQDRDLRPQYPLLSEETWLQVLADAGFSETSAVSGPTEEEESEHVVFLAREPDSMTKPIQNPVTCETGHWLIFADSSGVAVKLASMLREVGHTCELVYAGKRFEQSTAETAIRPDLAADYERLWQDYGGRADLRGVVFLWAFDTPPTDNLTTPSLAQFQMVGCYSAVRLVQAMTTTEAACSPRLCIVTRGAQPTRKPGDLPSVGQAPLSGLARVIGNEHPDLQCCSIDLSSEPDEDELAALVRELCSESNEPEVALRSEARYVQRIAHTSLFAADTAKETHFRVEIARPGTIENLTLRRTPRRPPQAGEVAIDVSAAALNFRDVMKTLGIYPTEAGDALILGDECVGSIAAVGAGVDGLREGDAVVALGGGCLASHVVVPADFVFHKPAEFTDEEAVTTPVAFLTAWYALHHLGRLQAGERVLIHAATGGVGLAAIQVARSLGAEVFATAGSTEKREMLRLCGIKHVMDSRSIDFADEVHERTGGQGVDIVLNSLAGDAIAKGIACLRPYGRFIEIGKRDIYQNRRLGMKALRNNLSLMAVDLGQAIAERPALVRSLLAELAPHFSSGDFRPLPYRVFPLTDVRGAFSHLAQARHIGKVVISMAPHQTLAIEPAKVIDGVQISPNASYLITGGLGGFGLAIAEWLVASGARHLALVGRSGASSEESRAAVARLQQTGAQVTVISADVSDEADVARVLQTISDSSVPLRGIIHAAMVLDDSTLRQLTPERFQRVLAPKVCGAWNLHQQTKSLPLDFFVMFSSGAAIVGNPGQANYVAANAFLDALAHHRRAAGLPALAVDWGMIGEVGYVSRREKIAEHLERQGLIAIAPRQATKILGRLICANNPQVAVMRHDWHKFSQFLPRVAQSPRYSRLLTGASTGANNPDGPPILERLKNSSAAEQQGILETYLREQSARVLRVAAAEIPLDRPLSQLGLDSLMAVELMNRIEADLKVNINTSGLLGGQSIVALARELGGRLSAGNSLTRTEGLTATKAASVPAATSDKQVEGKAFPLSVVQRELWSCSPFSPEDPSNHIRASLRLSGSLDISIAHQALREVIQHQSALRTVFRATKTDVSQIVLPTMSVPLEVIDLAALTPDEQTRQLEGHLRNAAVQSFNLSEGPLFRVAVFRLGPVHFRAVLSFHHAVFDGWSLGVLMDQWWSAYAALATGQSPSLPTLSLEYGQFARDGQHLDDQRLDQLLQFWRKRLNAPLPRIRWPSSTTATAQPAQREVIVEQWNGTAYSAWKESCRREGATTFMGLSASLTTALHQVLGQSDILLGSPIANRTNPATRYVIGSFSHLLLLRIDAGGNPAPFEMLRRAKRAVADALDHQDLPYSLLIDRLLAPAPNQRQEPFQVRLAYQNYPMPIPRVPGLAIEVEDEDSGTSRFDLALEAFEKPDGLRLLFKFRPQAVDVSTVREIARRVQNSL
jgi:acyl transferase domain-containing protein/acyl carrier protein